MTPLQIVQRQAQIARALEQLDRQMQQLRTEAQSLRFQAERQQAAVQQLPEPLRPFATLDGALMRLPNFVPIKIDQLWDMSMRFIVNGVCFSTLAEALAYAVDGKEEA